MNPTVAGIFLHIYLTPLLQEGSSNNALVGLVLFVVALILILVFWQWWQSVEGEANDRDVRKVDMVTVQEHEANSRPPASSARFAARIVPTAETAVAPPQPPPQPPIETAAAGSAMSASTAVDDLPSATEAEPAAQEPESEIEPAPVTPDDLTKIEGIGPKISQILQDAGLQTFADLAAAGVAQIEAVLEAAGPRYRLAEPDTWPQQAALAAAGDWDELQTLQEELSGGRVD